MAKKDASAPTAAAADSKSYTSFYLDRETRDLLEALTDASGGASRSTVVSSLIREAGSDDKHLRLMAIARELAEIAGV
jgi:hypothetical protein